LKFTASKESDQFKKGLLATGDRELVEVSCNASPNIFLLSGLIKRLSLGRRHLRRTGYGALALTRPVPMPIVLAGVRIYWEPL
jgi:hypothetical protein